MFPYPLLACSLVLMWMLLNGFTPGHLILGILVGVFASWAMAALRPEKPRLRKWYLLPKLLAIVLYDIIRSNIAVATLIVRGKRHPHHSAFLTMPLELEDVTGLTFLAVVITATPGSAWLEYNSHRKTVLLHVLDVIDEDEWIDTVKNRYERLLMEIFE